MTTDATTSPQPHQVGSTDTRIKALLNHPGLSEPDGARLKIVRNAVISTLSAYNTSPTSAKKRDWDAAEAALRGTLEELEGRYFPDAPVTEADRSSSSIWAGAPESWPNLTAVSEWLAAHFQRSARSIRRDLSTSGPGGVKKQALAFPRPDGKGYDLKEIQRYISENGIMPIGQIYTETEEQTFEELSELKRQKLQAERDRTRYQAERESLELEARRGELVPKAQYERDLAQRLRYFKQDLRQFAKNIAAETLHLLEAPEDRLPELKTLLLQRVEGVLNRYHTQAIQEINNADEKPPTP